jgi:hypothetical protein
MHIKHILIFVYILYFSFSHIGISSAKTAYKRKPKETKKKKKKGELGNTDLFWNIVKKRFLLFWKKLGLF